MKPVEPEIYEIVLEGEIDPSWSDWFHGFSVHSVAHINQKCTSVLSGPVIDQSALRGILNKIWDLNLTIVSLHRRSKNSATEMGEENEIHPTL